MKTTAVLAIGLLLLCGQAVAAGPRLYIFDGGLPPAIAETDGPVAIDGGTLGYDRWIVDQREAMGIGLAEVDCATFSHLHFDHAGAANAFAGSRVIMQQREWERPSPPAVRVTGS